MEKNKMILTSHHALQSTADRLQIWMWKTKQKETVGNCLWHWGGAWSSKHIEKYWYILLH